MNLTSQTLGNYQLRGVIGRGPRATVYRARQTPGDRTVAVKVYDESVDPDDVHRAVESVQALTHAHALPADDFGVHRGLAWVAMRHLPVGSIKSRWRGGVPLSDVMRILPQVTSALDQAHEHGLLHLNLKPANILLDRAGNAFVADFGIPADADSPYAAPEVGRSGAVDARTDVYAAGAVLYEMLTGRAPVVRRPRDDAANQRMADLPSPRSIRANIPPAAEAVVMRALSIDPDARYATPGALAEAFAQAVEATSVPPSGRAQTMRWIVSGGIGLLIVIVLIAAASGLSAPAAAPSPLPTIASSFTDTPPPTAVRTPTRTRETSATPTLRPATASPTVRAPAIGPTGAPTLGVSPTPVATPAVFRGPTPTPAFSVVLLQLRPFPVQAGSGAQLDLYFDAIVQPSVGGPYGQLFAFLPVIDSLVETRIGAQVSSGTQLLHVTLAVDCAQLPQPFTTHQIFLEIRETDRSPTLYATSIDYTRTWCR